METCSVCSTNYCLFCNENARYNQALREINRVSEELLKHQWKMFELRVELEEYQDNGNIEMVDHLHERIATRRLLIDITGSCLIYWQKILNKIIGGGFNE